MKRTTARTLSGAACTVAVLAGFGLTGCENPGTAAAHAVTQPSKSDGGKWSAGATKPAALAFLRKTFDQYEHGQAQLACAHTESTAYLAADPNCVSGAKETVAQFHKLGISSVPTRIRMDLHGTTGKATFTWIVNGQSLTTYSYLRFDGHRWWLTGDKTTGDKGL
jgi:hypothetical protein